MNKVSRKIKGLSSKGERECGFPVMILGMHMAVCLVLAMTVACTVKANPTINKSEVNEKVGKLHMPFMANRGQCDERVSFYAHTFGGGVFVTRDGDLVYSIPKYEEEKAVKGVALKEEFMGGKVADVKGEGKAVTQVNYFNGNDPKKWRKHIPTYEFVSLGELYEGVDLKLKAYGNNVEKLFYVKPGAEPKKIRVKISGGKALSVNKEGELEVETELGAVRFTRPVAYQVGEGKKEYIEVAYVVKGNEYGFKVGDYDRTRELVIDPLLAATFLGGSYYEFAFAIALDGDNNAYVAGGTVSPDFPGVGPGSADSIFAGASGPFAFVEEAFVAKLDSDLSTILAATFLGGSDNDVAITIALDGVNNVYVAGGTRSADFPGVGPGSADSTFVDDEGFIAKLDSNLSSILAATFLGGNSLDVAITIALDGVNNVYVAGLTDSADFPGVGPGSADSTFVDDEGFIAKLDSNLSSILAATFLGGSNSDVAITIALDGDNNAYVAGGTSSADFPGVGPGSADSTFVDDEGFIAKLDSNLSSILAATFLGGSNSDVAITIALDGDNNAYVAGGTRSADFPGIGPGSADSTFVDDEGFVAKLDSNLSSILAATFLGGNSLDGAITIALDGAGNVYVAGLTDSADFPGIGPGSADSAFAGLEEAFVAKLDSNLSSILAATFLGGNSLDGAFAIALDGDNNAYVAGLTDSADFPGIGPGSADSAFVRPEEVSVFLFSVEYVLPGEGFVAKLSQYLSNEGIQVFIDIKPQACPNPLNVKSKGVLPVAILGKTDLDVTDIDITSLRLNGVAPVRSGFEDVATPTTGLEPCECLVLSGDGTEDLTLKFDTQAIVAILGVVSNGDEIPLMLTGMLQDGTAIEGSDCVVIKGVK
jgi:hypothetical protein